MRLSLLQLVLLAIAAMLGLASLRTARVHFGRSPHPESRLLFVLAFLFLPPIVIGAVAQPATDQLRGVAWVPLYGVILAALTILMWVAALVAGVVAPGRSRPLLLLALIGSEGDPEEVLFDPPMTVKLAESAARVERANAVFGFPGADQSRRLPRRLGRARRGNWDARGSDPGRSRVGPGRRFWSHGHRNGRSQPPRHTPPPRTRQRPGLGRTLTRAVALRPVVYTVRSSRAARPGYHLRLRASHMTDEPAAPAWVHRMHADGLPVSELSSQAPLQTDSQRFNDRWNRVLDGY